MTTAEHILDLFGGPTPIHYRIFKDRNFFDMLSGPLTADLVNRHLNGTARYGVFSYSQTDNRARVLTLTTLDKGNVSYARSLMARLLDTLETLQPVIHWDGHTSYTAYLFLDTPLLQANANDIVGYLQHRTSHNLRYSPADGNIMSDWIELPLGKHPQTGQFGRFVDPRQGYEHGPQVDPDTAFTQRVDTAALLRLKESTLPPLSTAEAAKVQFGDRSVFPLLVEYVKRFPNKAAQFHPLEDFIDDLKAIADDTGREFIWDTTNSLGRHMASKRLRKALQETIGLLIAKEHEPVYGRERNTYAFRWRVY